MLDRCKTYVAEDLLYLLRCCHDDKPSEEGMETVLGIELRSPREELEVDASSALYGSQTESVKEIRMTAYSGNIAKMNNSSARKAYEKLWPCILIASDA